MEHWNLRYRQSNELPRKTIMNKRRGITLIELLVVIAIIAILAAILFPVFNRAKVEAKKRADSANLGSIHQALKLYENDQGGYPPLLLQVAEYDPNTNQLRNVKQLRKAYLYRGYVKDDNMFASAIASEPRDSLTRACWPNSAGVFDGNGNQQAFGPATLVTYAQLGIDPTFLNGDSINDPARFYLFDNLDVSPTRNPNCSVGIELRYILFWTQRGQAGGGPLDSTRQLGYSDPDESTVVTWNSFYRTWEGTPPVPRRDRSDLVLFLSGNIRPSDSNEVYLRSWAFGQ